MADQRVSITDMPTGPRENVALELWKQIRFTHGAKATVKDELRLFIACRQAVNAAKLEEGFID